MPDPCRVGLLIETSSSYGRGLLRGISQYAQLEGRWSLYLETSGPDALLPRLRSLIDWGMQGVMVRVHSRGLADQILGAGVPAVDLGYRYDGSPLLWDDGSAPPDRTDHRRHIPSAKPGGRAPHVAHGGGRSLLDLFGRGFVLVRTLPAADPSGLERAAAAGRVPLRVETIPEAAPDDGAGLTLVRPDGFVAWRGRTPPEDPAAVLRVVTGHAAR